MPVEPIEFFPSRSSNGDGEFWLFECPGCEYSHSFRVKRTSREPEHVPVWQFNRTTKTFSPSLLVDKMSAETRCHLFARNGVVEFLGDCAHDLKNTKVPFFLQGEAQP